MEYAMARQAPTIRPISRSSSQNAGWLAQIAHAQVNGRTCLPIKLGLNEIAYQAAVQQYALPPLLTQSLEEDLREELLNLRRDEWDEIRTLLLSGCPQPNAETETIATVVAAACLGGDHLWRDLGLHSRQQLRELLFYNFPELAARNVQNMRWKRFFYKQLCEQEGGYVCRSPTCEQCSTYNDCFGDEA